MKKFLSMPREGVTIVPIEDIGKVEQQSDSSEFEIVNCLQDVQIIKNTDGYGAEILPGRKRGSGMRNRFHAYLFGHHFTFITDSKAIMSVFDSNKPISPQASGRIQ